MIKKLFITLGLISFFSILYLNTSADTKQNAKRSIDASYTSEWSLNGFLDFSGNSLSENNLVTPETSELHFRRTSTSQSSYDLQLRDSKGSNLVKTSIPFSASNGTMYIPTSTFKTNESYYITVTEWDTSGRIIDLYKILNFSVASTPSTHVPPVIYAYSRIVDIDDSNFNIMEGVYAYDEDGTDITDLIKISGKVDIHKEGVYPITYSVTDKNGLSTHKNIDITVTKPSTEVLPPTLNSVTNNDLQVTGSATPGFKIFVVMGIETYTEVIREDGTFTINLEKRYAVGTGITAFVQDNLGKESSKVYSVVQQGEFTLGVNRIVSSDTIVTGNTIPNAQIEVSVSNSKAHIYYGVSDANGYFQISMNGNNYPAGTPVQVLSKFSGQTSPTVSVIVYPKNVTLSTLSVGDRVLSGEADANATIHISIGDRNYTFVADAAGKFLGDISPLQQGDRILAYQTSNGINGDITELVINSLNNFDSK